MRETNNDQARQTATNRITVAGAGVNLGLTVVKGVVGVLSGSSVLVADAAHSLSDLASDVVTLVSLRMAAKPPDEDHPYGHGRYETLGTVALSVVLLAVAAGIAWDALERFGTSTAPESIALWAALVSILAKEVLYQATVRVGKRYRSPLVIANAWHHRSDALSSVAAFAGILGARMGFPVLDPAAAVLVAAMIGWMALGLLRGAVKEVTDASDGREIAELASEIRTLPGVESVHELRARRMGPAVLVDLHVEVHPATTVSDGHQVAERVRKHVFAAREDVTEVLVHIDPEPDEDLAPGEGLARPRPELEEAIRALAGATEGVDAVTHVLLHFLRDAVTAQVHICVDDALRVEQARHIGALLRARLEELADVDHADIHLELDEAGHSGLPEYGP